ncbi:uncharacterized protein [Panulirus ornatus]|uniref:uncharacterized protein isoform X6 n=1 Tax=Panulirus ornatus TaxID=150431 RepID=UPI003A8B7DEB
MNEFIELTSSPSNALYTSTKNSASSTSHFYIHQPTFNKREVSASNFTVHTVHCQRNIAVCTLCNEAVPRTRYQQHVEANHTSVPCSKCGAEVEPLHIFSHEKEECPRRQVACHLCELEVAAAELARHVEYCGARTERCKGCSKYVQSKYLQFHYEHDHKYLRPEEKAERNGSDDEGAEECPICLGPVTLPLALECGHTFCMVCVKGIANTTKNCAICRRDIPRDMLMDIRFCREEDIIKHYVNKPRTKKNTRSHSVPSRTSSTYTGSSSSSSRRLVHHTTQEYDDMVSALLSSRTSSTSYRYQRPSNTHTPPSYTPYSSSSTSNSTTTNTTSSSSCQDSCNDSCKDSEDLSRDDDCCCSSSTTTAVASTSTSSTTTSTPSSTTTSSPSSTATNTTTTSTCKSSSAVSSSSSRPTATTATTTTTTTASNSKSASSARSSSASVRSGSASSANTRTVSSVTTRSSATTESTSSTSTTTSSTTSSSTSASTSSSTTTSYSSSYSNGARPRRPTSLALETISVLSELSSSVTSPTSSATGSSRSSAPKNTEPPKNATQEEYDRWLAFQLAKAEDDLPPAEFNRKHRPTFRRSLSMPERAGASSDSSSSSDSEDSDTPSSRRSSRRPPASPRNTTASSSSSSSSSSASSSTRSTPISKSSSDSSAATSSSSGGSALSTGARPKNTSLRKRVSFKEDAPPVRRQAPVMLPCEFCDEMFSERDLMRHQTSCEQNETQLPRTSRLAQRSAAATTSSSSSSTTASSSVSATVTATSSSSRVTSVTSSSSVTSQSTSSGPPRSPGPASPAPRRTPGRTPTPVCTPPRKSTAPNPASVPPKPTDSGSSGNRKSPAPVPPRNPASPSRRSPTPASLRSATTSPLPRCPPSLSPTPVSSPVTTTITIVDKPPCVVVSPSLSSGSSRPFSVSPAPCGSTSNSSVSSGSVSGSSVSTTPSTSSSASPVPSATPNRDSSFPNTPTTDVEMDYDEEDGPYMRPRRGRLLSSAIFSWRSISASGAASRRGYVRSNTAPLEDTGVDDETQPSQPVTTSRSATQLPASSHSPVPDTTTSSSSSPEHGKTSQMKQISPTPKPAPVQDHAEPVFIKNPNKYRAPPPPQSPPKIAPSSSPPRQTQKPSSTSSASHGHMNGHVKSPPPQENPPGKTVSSQEKHQVNGHVNGFIKLDSKPMMNGHTSKEMEELIPCEFCKQVYPPNKFQSHQTMCEATHRPPVLRPASPLDLSSSQKTKSSIPAKHNKGPAPPPPEDTAQKTNGSDTNRAFSPVRHRMERSQSVLDDRISYSEKIRVNRRLERASSISRSYYTSSPSPGRRWSSREFLHSNSLESSTSYASSGWSGSTSNIFCGGGGSGYTATHGWSSHVNMVRDDVRSRAAAATAAAAAATAAYYGGLRYRDRSSSRPRPSSMYSTSDTWGSMFDLHSPSRPYNISDAFSSASLACKKRYIR